MLVGAIILVISLIIASTLILLWPYMKMLRSRKDFFKREYKTVYEIAKDKDFYLINNVQLNIDTKVIHFDHILFGEKYIYCIGNYFCKGSISGKFSDSKWFLYKNFSKTEHIKNPLLLHKTRIDYLQSAIKAEDIIIGLCVANDECLIDEVKDAPDHIQIINQKDLKQYILKKEKVNIATIASLQLDSLVHTIYRMSNESKRINSDIQ